MISLYRTVLYCTLLKMQKHFPPGRVNSLLRQKYSRPIRVNILLAEAFLARKSNPMEEHGAIVCM
jgi:hypothetical protein